MALVTTIPSSVSSGLRLISTGNSTPSLRRPYSSSPAPMGRACGLSKKPAESAVGDLALRQAIHRQFLTSHREASKIRTITYALHSLEFDSVQAKARLKPELRAQTEQTKATTKTQRRKEFGARNTAQPGHPRYRKPTDNPSHGASNWALASFRINCACAVIP